MAELVNLEAKQGCEGNLAKEYLFWREARLGLDLNLRLAYFLIHAQRLSLSEATRALKSSKPLILNVLAENPLFISELRPIERWGGGGKERLIILSDEGKARITLLETIAQEALGLVECQRLRTEAGVRRRKILKTEEALARSLEADLKNLRRLKKKAAWNYRIVLKTLSKKYNMAPEEIESKL